MSLASVALPYALLLTPVLVTRSIPRLPAHRWLRAVLAVPRPVAGVRLPDDRRDGYCVEVRLDIRTITDTARSDRHTHNPPTIP